MIKKTMLTLAATLACVVATSAYAETGIPSDSVLNQIGLSSLQIMSDSDALAVRGMGYRSAKAWGGSSASIGDNKQGADSKNKYDAKGKNYAKGGNDSYATKRTVKKKTTKKNGRNKTIKKTVKIKTFKAGGQSWAAAG